MRKGVGRRMNIRNGNNMTLRQAFLVLGSPYRWYWFCLQSPTFHPCRHPHVLWCFMLYLMTSTSSPKVFRMDADALLRSADRTRQNSGFTMMKSACSVERVGSRLLKCTRALHVPLRVAMKLHWGSRELTRDSVSCIRPMYPPLRVHASVYSVFW